MQHPLEPLSRVLRLGLVTDTSVKIESRPPNTLEVVRDQGWIHGLQKPTKEELTLFIQRRVFVAERYLHPRSPAPSVTGRAALRDHLRAALYTLTAVCATFPLTAVYVGAAAHMARYEQLTPFSGNFSALRHTARLGGIGALWQGVVPLALGHLVDEATYRLRLGPRLSAAAYAVVYACEATAVRKMCWDPRYQLAGALSWSFGPLYNFLAGYLLTLVVNMSGVGYYLPLSSVRIWLMAHPYDTLGETVRLGSYWATFKGLLRGVRASFWSLIPRLALEYLALHLARRVINKVFRIKPKQTNPLEAMMGGAMGGMGGAMGGGMGGAMGGAMGGMGGMGGAAGGGAAAGMPPNFMQNLAGAESRADAPPPTAKITEPSSDINWEVVLDLFDEGQLVVVMYATPDNAEVRRPPSAWPGPPAETGVPRFGVASARQPDRSSKSSPTISWRTRRSLRLTARSCPRRAPRQGSRHTRRSVCCMKARLWVMGWSRRWRRRRRNSKQPSSGTRSWISETREENHSVFLLAAAFCWHLLSSSSRAGVTDAQQP